MKSFEFNQEKHVTADGNIGVLTGAEMITNEIFGDAADINRLVLQFGKHIKTFVLKDYEQKIGWNSTARETALHSAVVWEKIKSLGLPTYTTYRLEDNGAAVLMTDLERDGYSALSFNHAAPDWYDGDTFIQKIHSIENWNELMTEIKACAEKASAAGIILEPDAYFILVKELAAGSYDAKVFIGDFEGVTLPEGLPQPDDTKQSAEELRADSLYEAALNLTYFARRYMPAEVAENYVDMITASFPQIQHKPQYR